MVQITKENLEDFKNGFKCPKCGSGTNTHRHRFAKRWCPDCKYVLRQEGDQTLYNYINHLDS
jgi:Zn finger protein HypA/HybF involved in hydrogenase expression